MKIIAIFGKIRVTYYYCLNFYLLMELVHLFVY